MTSLYYLTPLAVSSSDLLAAAKLGVGIAILWGLGAWIASQFNKMRNARDADEKKEALIWFVISLIVGFIALAALLTWAGMSLSTMLSAAPSLTGTSTTSS
ncbi:MAG: hypothetical protein BWY57_00628 [Betaproteobacteria bacterium ADurb.Bin341]|nr:MAG: hypothetical protein BWY57_00628 [Betaproteobacteria bacterium ADurb.Bin341]